MATNDPNIVSDPNRLPDVQKAQPVSHFWYLSVQQILIDQLTLTWTALTYGGGITNVGAPYSNGTYARDSFGIVRLRGVLNMPGTFGTGTMFTLPAGYRPPATKALHALGASVYHVDLSTAGVMTLTSPAIPGGGDFVSLDGITFETA